MTSSKRISRRFRNALGAVAAVLVAVTTLTACGSGSGDSGSTEAGDPVQGGSLKVGIVGGSSKDSLDAHRAVTHPDEARVIQLYDRLLEMDLELEPQPALATDVTSNDDGTVWTVKLREDIKFSDGRPITVEDVIATFQRISDPENPTNGTASMSTLVRDGFVKVDEQTLEFHFTEPKVNFEEEVSGYSSGIVPADYDPTNPVGSGAYMLESFTPGQQSVFVRNPHYWRDGQPYLDEITIVDFPDDSARVNALLSGQVDAIDQVPLGQVKVIEGNQQLSLLESETSGFHPFTMRVDQAPFDDPKVRQAFRLIVDREEMVNQVLAGHGTVGNDMYSRYDACYPDDIPQRTQDIAKAKQLLKEAGQENLEIELVTSPVAAGFVEAAQVFAEQAKEAGVTVKVNKVDPGVFYGDQYLQWTFAQDFYFTHGYLSQVQAGSMPNAPYNETHWSDPEWVAIVEEALQTVEDDKRCDLIKQAQAIEFERGGYIVWGFPNSVDAHSTKVHGFEPDKSGIPLTGFRFRQVWINE